MKLDKLKNTFTALISPMLDNGELDEAAYRNFIRMQIKAGCGLVPMGTTGESATMNNEEHESIIKWCVEESGKSAEKPFVLAGSGSNSTKEAVALSKHAQSLGADGLLIITPYYNKPTQKGMIAHFSAIAEEVTIPIILYNVPGRTGVNMLPDTVAELASKYKNIVGYKAASGNIKQIQEVMDKCPKGFIVMSGDDGLTYDMMKMGGKGVISVASNIIPERMSAYTKMMEAGKWDDAQKEKETLSELFSNLFVETNPGPVKFAAELLGTMKRTMRLPMVPPEPESQKIVKNTLKKLELL